MIDGLYEKFKEKYDKQNAIMPFSNKNLFSTIHLSENDHTQILWDILRYRKNGKYVFINSFIKDCLGIDDFDMTEDEVVSVPNATQFPSLSNKSDSPKNRTKYGFIDLLLYDKDKAIIIENKVCDASDGDNQLARYYYTFAPLNDDSSELMNAGIELPTTIDSHTIEDENIYVVYLTKDESKLFPDEKSKSLPDFLKKRLKLVDEANSVIDTKKLDTSIPENSHYIHISYSENVINWIKENVLPEISAFNSNEFYQSVVLYVDYLENDLLGQTPKSMDVYTEGCYNDIVKDNYWQELYNELITPNEKLKNLDNDPYITPYLNFLRAQVTRKVNDKINEGWKSYCTPSFVLFYKEEWYDPASGGNIPLINYLITPSSMLNGTPQTVYFQIEHYEQDDNKRPKWKTKLFQTLDSNYKDKFNSDHNRNKTPRVKLDNNDIVKIDEGQIEIILDNNIKKYINECGFNKR